MIYISKRERQGHTHLNVGQVHKLRLCDGLVSLPEHALLKQQAALPALLGHLGVAELTQHVSNVPTKVRPVKVNEAINKGTHNRTHTTPNAHTKEPYFHCLRPRNIVSRCLEVTCSFTTQTQTHTYRNNHTPPDLRSLLVIVEQLLVGDRLVEHTQTHKPHKPHPSCP